MTTVPPWLDAPPAPEYPFEESHDLRTGPKLHPALGALLPFIGVWRGRGGLMRWIMRMTISWRRNMCRIIGRRGGSFGLLGRMMIEAET